MTSHSIEEAVLNFARKVKNDPESSQLLRDALAELESLLDPKAKKNSASGSSKPKGD